MKRLIITLTCIIITINVFGQWFAEADLGFALAPNKDNNWLYNTEIIYNDENGSYVIEPFPNKFTIAQSPFVNIKVGHKLNKIELGLGFTCYDNRSFENFNKYNTFHRERRRWISEEDNEYKEMIYDHSLNMRRYVLSPSISYIINIKSFTINPTISIALQLLNIYEVKEINTHTHFTSSSENINQYLTEIRHYEYPFNIDIDNIFIIKPGLDISYKLNSKFRLYGKFTYNYSPAYNAETKFRTLYERKENNTTITDDSKGPLISSRYSFNINTIDFSLGLRYYFGSTKNNGNDE
jgi:hypothetical protein